MVTWRHDVFDRYSRGLREEKGGFAQLGSRFLKMDRLVIALAALYDYYTLSP